jgi:multiple sugar transport system substrate-binding protein
MSGSNKQTISRREMLRLMGLGGVGSILAACAPQVVREIVTEQVIQTQEVEVTREVGVEQIVEVTAAPAAKGNIVFGSYTWDAFTPILNALVASFEAAHPEISVETQFAAYNEHWQKVQTQIAAGTPPDVGVASAGFIADFGSKGLLEPLEPYIERDGLDLSRYWPATLDQWRVEPGAKLTGAGPLLCLPNDISNNSCFVYNKTMFDKAGIAYPTDAWTWHDVREAALALTKDTGDPTTTEWGLGPMNVADGDWNVIIWQWGGPMEINEEYTECTLKDPTSMEALQWVYDLYHTDKVMPTLPFQEGVEPFLTGRIGMITCGSWVPTAFVGVKEFEWEVANWPRSPFTDERIVHVNPDAFTMYKGSANPDAGWEFLKYITAPDEAGTVLFASRFSNIPAVMELASSDIYLGQPGLPASYINLVKDLEFGRPGRVGRSFFEWRNVLRQTMPAAWSGELTLQEAVDTCVEQINAILAAL